jgi:hypothetical protein
MAAIILLGLWLVALTFTGGFGPLKLGASFLSLGLQRSAEAQADHTFERLGGFPLNSADRAAQNRPDEFEAAIWFSTRRIGAVFLVSGLALLAAQYWGWVASPAELVGRLLDDIRR